MAKLNRKEPQGEARRIVLWDSVVEEGPPVKREPARDSKVRIENSGLVPGMSKKVMFAYKTIVIMIIRNISQT